MKCLTLTAVSLAFAVSAHAQSTNQAAPASAADRIATQIGKLVIQTEQQQDIITALRNELSKAQAKIKQLEPKPDADHP